MAWINFSWFFPACTSKDFRQNFWPIPAVLRNTCLSWKEKWLSHLTALICVNFLAVSEASFVESYSSNPVNLVRVCDVCQSPQRRYILTRDHAKVPPQSKYLPYQQCLPGCAVVKKKTSYKAITLLNGKKFIKLTNDISCKAYDGGK